MKVIFHADHLFEAEILAEKLADAGIRPFIKGGHLTGAMGELPAMNLVTISVIDDDEEEGVAVIQQHFDELSAHSDAHEAVAQENDNATDSIDSEPDAPGLT